MWRAIVYGFFLVHFSSGCGGGGGTGTDTDTGPSYRYSTEVSFCEALAVSECNESVVKACYGSDDATVAEDQPRCAEARAAQCNPAGLPYHPERGEDCVEERERALRDAVWTRDELDAVESACLPVFSREGPGGTACESSAECDAALGLRCVVKLGQLKGICGEPVIGGGGESCGDPLAVCGEAFYCDAEVSFCLARPEDGEECSAAMPCAADFYCSDPEGGACRQKTKNGLDCDSGVVCSGGFCLGATRRSSGVCSSTLPLQIHAESCDLYRN